MAFSAVYESVGVQYFSFYKKKWFLGLHNFIILDTDSLTLSSEMIPGSNMSTSGLLEYSTLIGP